MGIEHENADVGAEADQFREAFAQYETLITKDEHNSETNTTTIEYIVGEGDPPFIKYKMTLEPIEVVSSDAYAEMKEKAKAEKAA